MSSRSQNTDNHAFDYIQQMLTELRIMSERENAPVLAYVIEMAIIEARDMSESVSASQTGPLKEVNDVKQLVKY